MTPKTISFNSLFLEPTRNGLTRPKAVRGQGVKMVNMGELFAHQRMTNVAMDRVPMTSEEVEKSKLVPGDLLFARQSLVLEGAGKCSIFLRDAEPVTFESHIIRVRLNKQIADPNFYYYYFQSSHGRNAILSIVEQGAGASGIRASDLAKLEVTTLPINEQRTIGEILSAFDEKIELNRQMAATLEEIARAIFKSWFIDFEPVRAKAEGRPTNLPPEIDTLFPDSFTNENLPMGWKVTSADKEFNIVMGQSPPGNSYNKEGNGEPFYQGRSDFGFRYPTARVFCTSPKRVAAAGDTLVSVRAPVGDINLAAEHCAIGRGVAAVRHKSGSQSFTYYSMISMKTAFDVFESEGTVFGSLGKSDFHSMQVIAPPQKLVDHFESVVGKLDEKIQCATSELLTLTELRDSLLPKLMNRGSSFEINNRLGEQPCSV